MSSNIPSIVYIAVPRAIKKKKKGRFAKIAEENQRPQVQYRFVCGARRIEKLHLKNLNSWVGHLGHPSAIRMTRYEVKRGFLFYFILGEPLL